MENNNCLFCKIIAGEIPAYKVYEDENFLSILDINPVNLGHTLIIPKKHFVNIFDAPIEIFPFVGEIIKKLAEAVKIGTNADGLNIIMNNNRAGGQLIDHSHIHLVPRFENDGFQNWKGKGGETEQEFKNIQISIKENLISHLK